MSDLVGFLIDYGFAVVAFFAILFAVCIYADSRARSVEAERLKRKLAKQKAEMLTWKVAEQGSLKILNDSTDLLHKRYPESVITGSDVLPLNVKELPTCIGAVLVKTGEDYVFVGGAIKYGKCLVFPGHVKATHEVLYMERHRGATPGLVELPLYDGDIPKFFRPSFNPDVHVLLLTKAQEADLGLQSAKPVPSMVRSAQVVCCSPATKESSQGKVLFDENDITELSYFGSTKRGFSGAPYMLGKQVYGMHLSGSSKQVNFGVPFSAITTYCDTLLEVERNPEGVDSTTAKWLFDIARGNQGRLFFAELDEENMMVFDTKRGKYTRIKMSTFTEFADSTNTQFETDENGVDQYLVGDAYQSGAAELRKRRGGKSKKNRIYEGLSEDEAPKLDTSKISARVFATKPKHLTQKEFDEAIDRIDSGTDYIRLKDYQGGKGLPRSVIPSPRSFLSVMNTIEGHPAFLGREPNESKPSASKKVSFAEPPRYVDDEVSTDTTTDSEGESDSVFKPPASESEYARWLKSAMTTPGIDVAPKSKKVSAPKSQVSGNEQRGRETPNGKPEENGMHLCESLESLVASRSLAASHAQELSLRMSELSAGAEKKALAKDYVALQEQLSDLNIKIKKLNKMNEEQKALTPEQRREKRRAVRQKKKARSPQTVQQLVSNAMACLREDPAALALMIKELTGQETSKPNMPNPSKISLYPAGGRPGTSTTVLSDAE
jgi:hypothetical protein